MNSVVVPLVLYGTEINHTTSEYKFAPHFDFLPLKIFVVSSQRHGFCPGSLLNTRARAHPHASLTHCNYHCHHVVYSHDIL